MKNESRLYPDFRQLIDNEEPTPTFFRNLKEYSIQDRILILIRIL